MLSSHVSYLGLKIIVLLLDLLYQLLGLPYRLLILTDSPLQLVILLH